MKVCVYKRKKEELRDSFHGASLVSVYRKESQFQRLANLQKHRRRIQRARAGALDSHGQSYS